MLHSLPIVADVTITPADLAAARPHYATAAGCARCLVAQAITRTLGVPLARVGFHGVEVYAGASAQRGHPVRSERRAIYRFDDRGVCDLIMAYDAGAFDDIARALPYTVRLNLVA